MQLTEVANLNQLNASFVCSIPNRQCAQFKHQFVQYSETVFVIKLYTCIACGLDASSQPRFLRSPKQDGSIDHVYWADRQKPRTLTFRSCREGPWQVQRPVEVGAPAGSRVDAMGVNWAKLQAHPMHVVMLGLDAAGKTTVLYRLKFDEFIPTSPTIGFNCEKVRGTVGSAKVTYSSRLNTMPLVCFTIRHLFINVR